MARNRSEYYSGLHRLLKLSGFQFSVLRFLFNRQKYPLFRLSCSSGGLWKTIRLQKKLKVCKFTEFNGHLYFSLNVPHWPSLAFDNMVAHGGMNATAAGSTLKQHMDIVIMAITGKCNYRCCHCYEYFNLGEEDTVPVEVWKHVISELQKKSVGIITFSGGEPMLRYNDLLYLVSTSDHSLSDIHIHTSGYGVTRERCVQLKNAGLVAAGIGLDDCDPLRNDEFRGYRGAFENAVNAINLFREAGIFTYVNFCPSHNLLNSGEISRYFELLRDLNVGYVRWLEPRPCGKLSSRRIENLLTDEDRDKLLDQYFMLNADPNYSGYPPVSYTAFDEAPENLGCMMGGNSLLYIDSRGNVEPCVFLPVSFGNIMSEEISAVMERMKKLITTPVHKGCPAISMAGRMMDMRKETKSPIPYKYLLKEFEDLYVE